MPERRWLVVLKILEDEEATEAVVGAKGATEIDAASEAIDYVRQYYPDAAIEVSRVEER